MSIFGFQTEISNNQNVAECLYLTFLCDKKLQCYLIWIERKHKAEANKMVLFDLCRCFLRTLRDDVSCCIKYNILRLIHMSIMYLTKLVEL